MTCASGYEFLHRPYPYPRYPFRLGSGEIVGYEGRYFSIPAFALLTDKRLFTAIASHPVATTVRLYINKDAGLSSLIEPTLEASGYERATPHYANVIMDLRTLLGDVFTRHSADSEYTADDFRRAHLARAREPYNLSETSGSGVSPIAFVHPNPTNIVPVAPSSTTIPATDIQLGALQFQDIDMDEIMWQPFPRPKIPATGTNGIPIHPIFPAALPGGQLPEFTALDEQRFGLLGLNVSQSGGVLITGDALLEGTSIKLLTGSGQPGASEGDFVEAIEWARFPADDQMNRYYPTQNSGCISLSGRQAIYEIPGGLSDDQVYMLDVSEAGASGRLIQTHPGNYHATSGIDRNGTATRGVHVVDRLLYSLNEINANGLAVGRSLINGKKVFGHFGGNDAGSLGQSIGGILKYANGNNVYGFGGVTVPLAGGANSIWEWATINNRLSPVSWGQSITSAPQGRPGMYGGPPSTTWTVGDIMAAGDGVIWFKRYNQWGTMDRIVFPATDKAGGGEQAVDTINFETHVFREGTDPVTGAFAWVELPPPESPVFTTQNVTYFRDTYTCFNVISLFFNTKPNHGFAHVNGITQIQWGNINELPRNSRFSEISTGARTTVMTPPTAYSAVTQVVGFFPSWKLRLYVTTNNQVEVPGTMGISAGNNQISFAPGLPFTLAAVDTFGPAVWDPQTNLNYLYFTRRNNTSVVYFAKMNSSYQIVHVNRVDTTDVILSGKSAILSI